MIDWAVSFLLSSLVMSIIILAVMLSGKLFAKALSAKTRYIIWFIVLIGLLVPFRPVFGNALITLETPSVIKEQTDLSLQNVTGNDYVPSIQDTEVTQNNTVITPMETVSEKDGFPISPAAFCVLIWGVVSAVILIVHIWRYIYFTRMIRRWGVFAEDERILSVFNSVKSDIGLSNKKIDLKICGFVTSSMLTGFFRPVLLLPERKFDEDELELIFKHEFIHYKRHDLLIKLLAIIATSIHWFNPFVYLMYAKLQTEGETSCDEAVLGNTDTENRRFYGEVIIGMISKKSPVRTALSTCFYAGKSNMKRRLNSIMDTKPKKKSIAVMGLVIVAALTLFSGTVLAASNPTAISSEIEITAERATDIPTLAETSVSTTPPPIETTPDTTTTSAVTTPAATTATAPAPVTASTPMATEITAERAKEIALAKVGGGTVKECKLDYEDDRKVYEIEIVYKGIKYEMDIDVIDGTITDYSSESKGHHGDDDYDD